MDGAATVGYRLPP